MRIRPAALAFALVGLVAPLTVSAGTRRTSEAFRPGNFVIDCDFSHYAADDPIVAPGLPGGSHQHSFFDNRSTSAFSTAETLRAGRTRCHRRADRSAYWVPTLYADGVLVKPLGAAAYYRRRTTREVVAFPVGLRIVAGDPGADRPQGVGRVSWNCELEAPKEAEPSPCPTGRDFSLRLHVDFPECWGGARLDSADHRSHMAYANEGECPVTHPVALPSLMFVVRYPVSGVHGLVFSSGSVHGAHADAMFVWQDRPLRRFVEGCLNASRRCERAEPLRR